MEFNGWFRDDGEIVILEIGEGGFGWQMVNERGELENEYDGEIACNWAETEHEERNVNE